MLKKSYSKTGRACRVTFKIPADHDASNAATAPERVAVVGDWNAWSPQSHPLARRKDGSYSTTISLEAGNRYRFRYLLDDRTWANDDQADELVPNRFGGRDGVVAV